MQTIQKARRTSRGWGDEGGTPVSPGSPRDFSFCRCWFALLATPKGNATPNSCKIIETLAQRRANTMKIKGRISHNPISHSVLSPYVSHVIRFPRQVNAVTSGSGKPVVRVKRNTVLKGMSADRLDWKECSDSYSQKKLLKLGQEDDTVLLTALLWLAVVGINHSTK